MDWDTPPRRLVSVGAAVGAIVVLLLMIGTGNPPSRRLAVAVRSRGPGAAMVPSTGGRCSGPVLGSVYNGTLVNVGGPSPGPSVSGQDVVLSYRYTVDFHPKNGSQVFSCLSTSQSQDTNSTGGFDLNATIPTNTCAGKLGCDNYTGPFAPVRFSMGFASELTGDFLTWTIAHGVVNLSRVAALSRVTLDPSGAITVSEDDPIAVTASPLAANGQPSPSNMTFNWKVTGAHWDVIGSWNDAVLTIEGLAGAQPTTVELWANGSYNGSVVNLPETSVSLSALPTEIRTASVNPTSVDLGSPATFRVAGTGAAGYPYSLMVAPGLYTASVETSCAVTNFSESQVRWSCSAQRQPTSTRESPSPR